MKTEKNSRFAEWIDRYEEVLATIVGIVTSIAFLVSKVVSAPSLSEPLFLVSIILLNILVLILCISAINPTVLDKKDEEYKKLQKELKIEKDKEEGIRTRVNALAKQLSFGIQGFGLILILFYGIELLEVGYFHALNVSDGRTVSIVKERDKTVWELAFYADSTGRFTGKAQSNPVKRPLVKDSQNKAKSEAVAALGHFRSVFDVITLNPINTSALKGTIHRERMLGLLTLELFANAFNLLSASCLLFGFRVLFSTTLRSDNTRWKLNYVFLYLAVALLITMSNLLLCLIGFGDATLLDISQGFRLIGGIYNAVAMSLLFGRFVAMEFFYQHSKESWERSFYLYGTLVILPLYVAVQPLYGILLKPELLADGEALKSFIFMVCLWGKLVFFLFVITMLRNKWLHSYLFMVISQNFTLWKISNNSSNSNPN